MILSNEGLKNPKISQILLAGLTADPLKSLYQSLVSETRSLTPTEQKIMNSVFKRFQDLVEERNNVIHSTTFVGFGIHPEGDYSLAIRTKFRKVKSGAAFKMNSVSAREMDSWSKEAESLWHVLTRLNGCLAEGLSIEGNFVFDSNGVVSVP